MLFGDALTKLQTRKAEGMRLPKWNEDVVIKLQYPDEHSKMTHPYLYVESRFGCVPWKETVVEMFDDGWELVNEIKEDTNDKDLLKYLNKLIDWDNLSESTMDSLEFKRCISKEEISRIAKNVMESDKLSNEEKMQRFEKLKNLTTIRLIPTYLVPIIPVGLELVCVNGEKIIYDGTNINKNDILGDCIRYGLNPKEEKNA